MLWKFSALVLLFGLAGCFGDICVNEVREELVSPDGKKKIVVFTRNCGATTGFNTQASVLEKTEKLPEEGGTAFIVDKGAAKVSWKKDGSILVILDGSARVLKKEPSVRGISIEYREEKRG
jgi:2-keto-4-pentenoate hydratase/2-oxohepta-3-ene-1,7-dioic acid hydratase in catechol pathway